MSEVGYRVALLASIPLLWCGVCLVLSWASGWWMLSHRYLAKPGDGSGDDRDSARMRSARIGAIQYHSSLNFIADSRGLRISVFFPFRPGHPPLFVPWSEFDKIRLDNRLFSQRIKMAIGRPAVTRVVFPGWVKFRMPIEYRSRDL
ncbi:hypothetical protein Pla52o_28460 [Novipirellula galeiformis]|uniref:Uncharacterized protein n=2 Tax=Novipirellula galeiformis TaxID=2528004 RepID=A0A5C6CFB9_9BACT|nr:hypothetical protein Pla52o_28460 [Novipirellula galeiformis]